MSRPTETTDAVGEVTERLRVWWATLTGHKQSFASGDDKKFYELVQRCYEQLWEAGVEYTYETG